MQAPEFWYADGMGWQAALLLPAAAIYSAVAARRFRRKPEYKSSLPVICIGNPTVGGAGKTPTAIHVAERLIQLGRKPVFLSRGYKARVGKPTLVDPARHSAADVGDEALLLARHAPAIVSPDRVAGAMRAEREGDIIVMDDGFQNPALAKDVSILVVDSDVGLGNGIPLPAGPLRLPLGNQLAAAQAVLLIGSGARGDFMEGAAGLFGRPVMRASFKADEEAMNWLSNRPVVAFAGIGRPEKFFGTLERLGADIVYRQAFPDHHAFTRQDARSLLEAASKCGAGLVTTEKDAARLGTADDGPLEALARESVALPVRLAFLEDSAATLDRLLGAVAAAQP